MSNFHKEEEVEVARLTSASRNGKTFAWRKAKIIFASTMPDGSASGYYTVRFQDGSHGLVDTKHLRSRPVS